MVLGSGASTPDQGDQGDGCQPASTVPASRIDAATLEEICVDPVTRWLTSIGFPLESTLSYSQKRSDDVSVPPVIVHPAGLIALVIVQLI
jgi:hypothetical protein